MSSSGQGRGSLAARIGVTRVARVTGLDRTGVEVACAVRPLGHVLQVTNGKGGSFAEAQTSALGEAAELWAAERIVPEELVYATPAGMRTRHGADAIWDGDLGSAGRCLAPELWSDGVFCAFREGRDLFQGTPVFVPASAVHCAPPGAAPIGPLLWPWTSNGMGAHPNRKRALRHALLEAVERDQLARALPQGWTPAAMSKRAIDPRTLSARLRRLLRRLEAARFAPLFFDLTPRPSLGLPVVGALLQDLERGPVPLTAGYACRFDVEGALLAALIEAAQSRLTDIHGARDDVEPMDARAVAKLCRIAERLRPRRNANELPRPPRDADEAWLLRQLGRAGHRRVAVLDLAPSDLGCAVIKIVAPSLRLSELPMNVVAFLGPSLPASEVRGLPKSVEVLPPAGRGDVWRALAMRPRAIALIDGLFEASPSVWHREILEALEAGVGVFGGASMGALRAVELRAFGMVGVGQVYRWFKDGTLNDDLEVALLHAGAAHGHRPLTLPLVNVRWAAQRAREKRVLTPREAASLVAAAAAIFYQERTWSSVLGRLGPGWSGRDRFRAYAADGLPDLKAVDARAVLSAAAQFARAGRRPTVLPRWRPASPLVRAKLGGGAPGTLLGGLARSLGLQVKERDLATARRTFARERGWPLSRLDAEIRRAGLNDAEALRFFEELALARLATERGPRLLPGVDAPGVAGRFEARLSRG